MKKSLHFLNGQRLTVLAMVMAFLGGGLFALAAKDKVPGSDRPAVTVQVDPSPLAREGETQLSFSPIVKRVAPSVVKVVVRQKAKEIPMGHTQGMMPFDDPMLRRFFGPMMPDQQGGGLLRQPPQTGLGSGVIVSKDGYILTNNHVVDEADEVVVTLADGRELTASVVGKDEKTDVAVIKVDSEDLPAANFRWVLIMRISSRPMRPSTQGTRAARWSTCRAV